MGVHCKKHGFNSRFRDVCPDCQITKLKAELAEVKALAKALVDATDALREADKLAINAGENVYYVTEACDNAYLRGRELAKRLEGEG
jgi:hypothetical protein